MCDPLSSVNLMETHLEGIVIDDSWVLDAGAELGTADTFNEDEGATPGGLLLELPIDRDDSGKVEVDGT